MTPVFFFFFRGGGGTTFFILKNADCNIEILNNQNMSIKQKQNRQSLTCIIYQGL